MSGSGVVEWGWQAFFLLVYEVVGGVLGTKCVPEGRKAKCG